MKKILLSTAVLSLVFFTGCSAPVKKSATSTTSPTAQSSVTSANNNLFDMSQNLYGLEESISTNYKKAIEVAQALITTNPSFCNLIIETSPGRSLEFATQKFLFESADMKDYHIAVVVDPSEQRTTREFIVKKDVPEIKCTKLTSPATKISYPKAYYALADTQEAMDLDQSGLTEKMKMYLVDPVWKIEFWGNNLKDPAKALLSKSVDYESGIIEVEELASPTASVTVTP